MKIPLKLPFVQHSGIGLYTTPHAVVGVELTRIRERVWIRGAASVQRDPDEAYTGTLARLIETLNPHTARVASHVPSAQVREATVALPHFNDSQKRADWVRRYAVDALLPSGVDVRQFAIRHTLLHGGDGQDSKQTREGATHRSTRSRRPPSDPSEHESTHREEYHADATRTALVVVANRSAIDDHDEQLRSVGLVPHYIGGYAASMGLALGFEPEGSTRTCGVLFWRAHDALLGLYQNGHLTDVHQLPDGKAQPQATLENARLIAASQHGSTSADHAQMRDEGDRQPVIYTLGFPEARSLSRAGGAGEHRIQGGGPNATSTQTDHGWPISTFSFASDLLAAPDASAEQETDSTSHNTTGPDPAGGLAVELAARLVYDYRDGSNLLDLNRQREAREDQERSDAMLLIGGASLLVFLLLVGSMGGNYWMQRQIADSQSELNQAAEQLARVDQARSALEQAKDHQARAERLAAHRTQVGALVAYVGDHAPEALWLNELLVEIESDEPLDLSASRPRMQVRLDARGWSRDHGATDQFIEHLDASPFIDHVQPVYVEALQRAEVQRRTRTWNQPLTQFELRLQVDR